MKRFLSALLLLAGSTAVSSPAQAVLVSSIVDNGNAVTDQGTGPGVLAFDIDWVNLMPVTLTLTVEAGDLGGDILLSHVGVHPNNPGNTQAPPAGPAWSDYHLLLTGQPLFSGIGLVFADTTGLPPSTIQNLGNEINIFFDVPEASGLALFDQAISIGQMTDGETFTLTINPTVLDAPAVPEPATLALLVIASAAGLRRHRRGDRV